MNFSREICPSLIISRKGCLFVLEIHWSIHFHEYFSTTKFVQDPSDTNYVVLLWNLVSLHLEDQRGSNWKVLLEKSQKNSCCLNSAVYHKLNQQQIAEFLLKFICRLKQDSTNRTQMLHSLISTKCKWSSFCIQFNPIPVP